MSHVSSNKGFSSDVEVDAFIMHYYEHPDPSRIPALLQSLARAGKLSGRLENLAVLSFVAHCIRQHPDNWREWLQPFPNALSDTAAGLCFALRLSGNDCPEGICFAQHVMEKRPPELLQDPVDAPELLDMLWGAFFATGDAQYVRRIMEALELVGDMRAVVVKATARWSLTSNVQQHPRVRDICKQVASDAATPSQLRSELNIVLQ